MPPVTVGDDQLFVMGDNRPNSSDSRVFGPISQDLAVGKAWLRIWPLNKFGIVEHEDLDLPAPATARRRSDIACRRGYPEGSHDQSPVGATRSKPPSLLRPRTAGAASPQALGRRPMSAKPLRWRG